MWRLPSDDLSAINQRTLSVFRQWRGSVSRLTCPRGVLAAQANNKMYERYMYEGANHAFNNGTNAPRHNKEAATLAWNRTITFLKKHLAA